MDQNLKNLFIGLGSAAAGLGASSLIERKPATLPLRFVVLVGVSGAAAKILTNYFTDSSAASDNRSLTQNSQASAWPVVRTTAEARQLEAQIRGYFDADVRMASEVQGAVLNEVRPLFQAIIARRPDLAKALTDDSSSEQAPERNEIVGRAMHLTLFLLLQPAAQRQALLASGWVRANMADIRAKYGLL